MSMVHHGPIHDTLSSIGDSILSDSDRCRTSVVSCLVPTTVAIAAR
jgi:hypothetical protein